MDTKKVEITAIVVQKTYIPMGEDARMNRTYPHTRYLIRGIDNKFYAWNAYNRHDLSLNGVYHLIGSIKTETTDLIELTRCKINTHLTKRDEK